MSTESNSLPGWFWGGLTLALLVFAVLLMLKDTPQEPGPAFSFELDAIEAVDPSLIHFEETGRLKPDIPRLSALAYSIDDDLFVAGENAIARYRGRGGKPSLFAIEGRPNCMAAAHGSLLLGMGDHVEVYSLDGEKQAAWDSLGEKAYITSIAANADAVYIADAGQRKLFRYDHEGTQLSIIGTKDKERGIPGFIVPSPYFDVLFDPDGALWVVNPGRHGLEQYRSDGSIVSSWYKPGSALDSFCGCCNPIHAAFRPDRSLVTVEKGTARVKVYGIDQRLESVVAPPEVFQTHIRTDDMDTPFRDLAVDAHDRIFVLDGAQGAVLIFEKKEAETNDEA
jgi:hypothetical protein